MCRPTLEVSGRRFAAVRSNEMLYGDNAMACCDWETFKDSFLAAWRKARNAPGELLIDWKKARKDWKRNHCTGGEAATMQLRELAKDGEYLWLERTNKRRGGDGGMAVERVPEAV